MADTNINITEIMQRIPHRYPILLVDKIVELVKGETATGLKNVTFNEPHFQGHFPDHPVMPGILIIEALAQTAAVLVVETEGVEKTAGSVVYFTSIDGAKFRKPVIPGDVLHLKVKALQHRKSLWKFEAKAYVEDKLVTEGTISAMMMKNV